MAIKSSSLSWSLLNTLYVYVDRLYCWLALHSVSRLMKISPRNETVHINSLEHWVSYAIIRKELGRSCGSCAHTNLKYLPCHDKACFGTTCMERSRDQSMQVKSIHFKTEGSRGIALSKYSQWLILIWSAVANLLIGYLRPNSYNLSGNQTSTLYCLISVGKKFMWVGISCGPPYFNSTCLD